MLKRVDRLDPCGFDERPVARVTPPSAGPYRDGCHTLSDLGDRTLVDAVGRRFSAAAFRHELVARVRGLARR